MDRRIEHRTTCIFIQIIQQEKYSPIHSSTTPKKITAQLIDTTKEMAQSYPQFRKIIIHKIETRIKQSTKNFKNNEELQ